MLVAVSPNWNHLPYFLLFSSGFCEALLSARIEDWAGVNNTLPRLQASSAILHNCFLIDLKQSLHAVCQAASDRNLNLFSEHARGIESRILASLRSQPFKFEPDAIPLSTFPDTSSLQGSADTLWVTSEAISLSEAMPGKVTLEDCDNRFILSSRGNEATTPPVSPADRAKSDSPEKSTVDQLLEVDKNGSMPEQS